MILSMCLRLTRFATFGSRFLLHPEILYRPSFFQLPQTALFCLLQPAGSLTESGTPPTTDGCVYVVQKKKVLLTYTARSDVFLGSNGFKVRSYVDLNK